MTINRQNAPARFAVAATDARGLKASVSAHFGHSEYFVIADVAPDGALLATSYPNPYASRHAPGQLPQYLADLGVHVVLAGGMGGGAIDWFAKLGVSAATGCRGTAREAIQAYRDGALNGATGCTPDGAHECGEHGHG